MTFYKNILLNKKQLLHIYYQIVENMCVQRKEYIDNILMSLDKHSSNYVDRFQNPMAYIYRDGLPLPVSEDKTMSYIDKCSSICSLDKEDAANELCKFLKVNLNFFTTNERNYSKFSGPLLKIVPNDKSHFYGNEYLNFDRTGFDKVPLEIAIKGVGFKRIDEYSIFIHNFRREIFSIIFFYYCEESRSYFWLNSYMQQVYDSLDKYICIPNLSNNNLFSNIHLINSSEYLDAQIIIFEDKYLFSILSEHIKKQSINFHGKFIITCRHADYSKESVKSEDFNIFKDRNVVYVPSFDKKVYINSLNLLENLKNCSDQVMVYKYPVVLKSPLHSDGSFTDEGYKNSSDAWYNEIFSNLLIYDNFLIEELLIRICEKSVSATDFKKWMSGLGLISKELAELPDHQSDDLTVDELIAYADSFDLSEERLYDRWINPYDTTFIYAKSDVGKGLFILTLSLSLAYKFSSFNFSVDNSRKVYLLDGETPKVRMGRQLKQLKIAYNLYNKDKKYLSNLKIYCKLGSKFSVDMATEKGRSQLKDKLVQNKFDVLVIDNLNSFCREFIKSSSSWAEFENWLTSLKQSNISIILVHHTIKNQDDIYKGPAEMGSQSQNVINLKNYEIDEKMNYSPGASISISFIKCKEMPELTKEKFAFYIENVKDISQAKSWVDLTSADTVSTDSKILYKSFNEKFRHIYGELSDRQKMIIGQFSLNCELKRKDIELNTGLKRTAIGDLLRSLIDNKFIISVENGRNQKYKINPIIFIN
jgi:hypothetical protein